MSRHDREALAGAFGRNIDPLAEFEEQFRALDIDPFDMYVGDVLEARGLKEDSLDHHLRSIDQWKSWCSEARLHPVCPNSDDAREFGEFYLSHEDNDRGTVARKMAHLRSAFAYFGADEAFPHDTTYNPFAAARAKMNLHGEDPKEPPRIKVPQMREHVAEIRDIRDRAIILTGLKLGVRAGEVCNMKLKDIHISHAGLLEHYDELGTNRGLEDNEDAIYIPFNKERDGNKSERPRLLPLDDELRQILLEWLVIRADCGRPWLFISDRKHLQMEPTSIRDVWMKYFRPEFDETERHASVSSHYGRHFFTTFWRVEEQLDEALVKYMRGDVPGGSRDMKNSGDSIHSYIHTHYDDIEEVYRNRIFRLTDAV